jgi:antitoxin ParD1/3/4
MPTTVNHAIILSAEHFAFIDSLVESCRYASASEVVREGLRALQDSNAANERWLREEVASAYDAKSEDSSRGVPAGNPARKRTVAESAMPSALAVKSISNAPISDGAPLSIPSGLRLSPSGRFAAEKAIVAPAPVVISAQPEMSAV